MHLARHLTKRGWQALTQPDYHPLSYLTLLPLKQASTKKLERELADAQQAAQRAADKAAETAEDLRVSREEAERAKAEGSRTAAELKRQVRDLPGISMEPSEAFRVLERTVRESIASTHTLRKTAFRRASD